MGFWFVYMRLNHFPCIGDMNSEYVVGAVSRSGSEEGRWEQRKVLDGGAGRMCVMDTSYFHRRPAWWWRQWFALVDTMWHLQTPLSLSFFLSLSLSHTLTVGECTCLRVKSAAALCTRYCRGCQCHVRSRRRLLVKPVVHTSPPGGPRFKWAIMWFHGNRLCSHPDDRTHTDESSPGDPPLCTGAGHRSALTHNNYDRNVSKRVPTWLSTQVR